MEVLSFIDVANHLSKVICPVAELGKLPVYDEQFRRS